MKVVIVSLSCGHKTAAVALNNRPVRGARVCGQCWDRTGPMPISRVIKQEEQ